MDILTPEARSAMMSRIRGKDTAPALAVRRILFALGYRYRLHPKALTGRPDLDFPARRNLNCGPSAAASARMNAKRSFPRGACF